MQETPLLLPKSLKMLSSFCCSLDITVDRYQSRMRWTFGLSQYSFVYSPFSVGGSLFCHRKIQVAEI